jgi:AraC-like DNA-binding protein
MSMKNNVEDLIDYYSFPKKEGPYSSIRPLNTGHSKCSKGHIYGPFRRKCFIFQYILNGQGSFESPYGSYTPKSGDLIIMHRGDLVDYGCYGNDSWESVWIDFDCSEKLPTVFETGVIHNENLREIFLELIKIKDMTHGQTAYATGLIWKIISVLDTDEPMPKHYSKYIDDALTYIHRHYIQKITVSEVANNISLNRSYFCSLFKKEVGTPPKDYIDNYRMSAACGILKQSSLSMSEVAEKAGYSDLAAFSKAFKLRMGISPKQYREKYKK